MLRTICACVVLLTLALTVGCKSNEYKKLGESCSKDGDCVTDAFCIVGNEGKKMCMQKCGSDNLTGTQYPDCPDGWTCGGMADIRIEETGEQAFGGLANYAICIKPEWAK